MGDVIHVRSQHHCTGKKTHRHQLTANQHMIFPVRLPAASGMDFSRLFQKTEERIYRLKTRKSLSR